jgi:hypothetical protein
MSTIGTSAGGPVLRALELVEAEHGKLAGDHPRQGMQRMGDPFLVGHDRDSLERRMMLKECTETQLQVLDQPAGPEALIIGLDNLDDPDLAALQQPSMAGLNSRRSSPRSRPDTRMPVTPSGMPDSTSIIAFSFLAGPKPLSDRKPRAVQRTDHATQITPARRGSTCSATRRCEQAFRTDPAKRLPFEFTSQALAEMRRRFAGSCPRSS